MNPVLRMAIVVMLIILITQSAIPKPIYKQVLNAAWLSL